MEKFKILVIDDEKVQREMIGGFLQNQDNQIYYSDGGLRGVELAKKERFDLIITDYKMPDMNGLDVLKTVKKINPETPVILLTAYGTVENAVEAMKEGAYDYITKPIDLDELSLLIERIKERHRLISENRELKERLIERYNFQNIVAESGVMQNVLSLVKRVSESDATILIRGESGTGKELIAKAIHYNSPRHNKSLIKVNCGAIPENLLESELFGHERGAFTGAIAQRIGKFELADEGTIFLDEIGDLSLSLQVKLLRVLQEKEFEKIGSNKTIKVNVRIISATNQDLEKAVKEKRFREDLYYRLNVLPIFIPPLRERKEDIPLLIEYFIKKFAEENKKKVNSITPDAKDILMKYDYPGNIRELENIIARAVVLTRDNIIGTDDLPLHLNRIKIDKFEKIENSINDILNSLEKRMIIEALEKNKWIQTKAAEELGISERVLRYKIKKYKIKESL